mmetsp:Transcript_38293/g.104271  ORF Transcript_38293/g.104271 Transcript_38293/m.104271 type:complete len:247 (-) Transcript_38293:192-932(-)
MAKLSIALRYPHQLLTGCAVIAITPRDRSSKYCSTLDSTGTVSGAAPVPNVTKNALNSPAPERIESARVRWPGGASEKASSELGFLIRTCTFGCRRAATLARNTLASRACRALSKASAVRPCATWLFLLPKSTLVSSLICASSTSSASIPSMTCVRNCEAMVPGPVPWPAVELYAGSRVVHSHMSSETIGDGRRLRISKCLWCVASIFCMTESSACALCTRAARPFIASMRAARRDRRPWFPATTS